METTPHRQVRLVRKLGVRRRRIIHLKDVQPLRIRPRGSVRRDRAEGFQVCAMPIHDGQGLARRNEHLLEFRPQELDQDCRFLGKDDLGFPFPRD